MRNEPATHNHACRPPSGGGGRVPVCASGAGDALSASSPLCCSCESRCGGVGVSFDSIFSSSPSPFVYDMFSVDVSDHQQQQLPSHLLAISLLQSSLHPSSTSARAHSSTFIYHQPQRDVLSCPFGRLPPRLRVSATNSRCASRLRTFLCYSTFSSALPPSY